MEKINKDMLISDIIAVEPGFAKILLGHGMHCVGCGMAKAETLAQACGVHGVDVDKLEQELNDFLATTA